MAVPVTVTEGEPLRPAAQVQPERTWGLPSLLRIDWLRNPEGLPPGRGLLRVAVAFGLGGAALAIRYLGDLAIGGDLGFVIYVAAVAMSAWIGGLTGGALTTAICAAGQTLFFLGPAAATEPASAEVLRVAIFIGDGVLISAITSALRRLSFREFKDHAAVADRYHSEREAHDRAEASRVALERLQTITASLTQAATPLEVAEAVLQRGMTALGAAAGGVTRVTEDGTALQLIAIRGYPDAVAAANARYALDRPSQLSQAVATRQPIFIPNMAEWRKRYPQTPPRELGETHADAAMAVVPLLVGERVLGTLLFRFQEAQDFGDGTSELIVRLGDQCAQALDRAIAYEEQVQALDALERSNHRLTFIARASDLLGSTREPESMLQAVARAACGSVADWCVIELFDADRPVVVVGHPSASGTANLRELVSIAPQSLGTWLVPGVMRGSGAVLHEPEAWRDQLASPRATELLDELGAISWLVAPISSEGAVIGAVTWGSRIRNLFDRADLATAQDLSARLATTLDRSRLYESVTRFKTTVDASLDAVYMFDPRSLELTYVNRGAEALAGADHGSLTGASVLAIQPQFTRSEMKERIRPLLMGRVPSIAYTGTLARADGIETPIDALLQCVRQPDGTLLMVLTARDVGERIEAQARLSRAAASERRRAAELNAILEAMREGILVTDERGEIALANAAAKEIVGGAPRTMAELSEMLGVDAPWLPSAQDSTEERSIELTDGRWIEVGAYPTERTGLVGDGDADGTIVVLRDITRIREAAAAQEAFMGVLSHELRTPVTSIFGYAKVLQRPGMREQSSEILEDIEAESDRLYRIVEDLLALSRVQAGLKAEGEPLLLQHLVPALAQAEQQRWPQVTIQTELPNDLATVAGERTYVEQVLRNLLSNAAKYSPPGTTVTVTGRTGAHEVEIRVLDRGSGIAPNETEQIFRLFYRSPSTARKASGAGIGLYVCRGLVNAMGGRIWASAREGGGSEFGFTLPIVEAEVDADEA